MSKSKTTQFEKIVGYPVKYIHRDLIKLVVVSLVVGTILAIIIYLD